MQSEYGAPDPPDNLDDMEAKPASNLESDTSVLLELVRGFRSEMLRVESTLRATMFRAVRYLVRIALVFVGIIDVTTLYLAPARPRLNPFIPDDNTAGAHRRRCRLDQEAAFRSLHRARVGKSAIQPVGENAGECCMRKVF